MWLVWQADETGRQAGSSVEPPPVQLPLEVATCRGRVDECLSAQELEWQALVSAQEAVESKILQAVELAALAWLSS